MPDTQTVQQDTQLSFKVAEFDAPLDLILHLLSKHKLDIMDIDISSLLEQYMETISMWQQASMDIASEFLEMASRLVYMKTVSLLPKHEEESEQLREALTGQLVEYRLCKLAAERLGTSCRYGDVFVREPMEIEMDMTYTLVHPAGVLYAALMDAQGRGERRLPPPQNAFEQIVTRPVVSVTSKIFSVLRMLRMNKTVDMNSLFSAQDSKSGVVATFLALLELIKSKKVEMDDQSGDISLKA